MVLLKVINEIFLRTIFLRSLGIFLTVYISVALLTFLFFYSRFIFLLQNFIYPVDVVVLAFSGLVISSTNLVLKLL